MGKYMKCPRCELNWILESDEYCDVCKAEMGMEGFHLLEDEEEDILCPVCGINYIERNKKMCADCLAKSKTGNSAYVNDSDSDAESEIESQPEESQSDNEEGIEKISFDEIDEEEKFDIYDDAFDDQDDFSANDFGKSEFDEEEEPEEEEVTNAEDDEFEADFNYNIDDVEDIDDDDEDDEDLDENDED